MAKPKCVVMPLAEGFEETEAVAVIDILRRADITVLLAGLADKKVTSARGVTLLCDCLLSEVDKSKLDGVVLPGGQPGTKNLMQNILVRDLVVEMDRQNLLVGAICAAPTVLLSAGILNGRKATSFPATENEMAGAVYSKERVVVDGNVVTSRAMGTSIEFGLKLVEQLVGPEKAKAIASAILANC